MVPERAAIDVSGSDHRAVLAGGSENAVPGVETQTGLARTRIRSVALKAILRKDRTDVPVEHEG